LFDVNQSDVTGTVNMANPAAVADAICSLMASRHEGFDEDIVRQGFIDLEDIFWGRYPGLLPCDTPYHDLRHSMSTALAMARMVDGYEAVHGSDGHALGADLATLGVLLALFHDVGFIRRLSEAGINGACLIREHEQRSVDFTRVYLAAGPLAPYAEYAELFQEFVAAGADRTVGPGGETVILYASPEDLLRKTPGFYDHLVKRRLDENFSCAYRYIAPHFGGDDPYARAMQRNLDFLRGMIARDDFSGLHRKPVPLMPVPAK
jgi:hypothetical protein